MYERMLLIFVGSENLIFNIIDYRREGGDRFRVFLTKNVHGACIYVPGVDDVY